MHDEFVCYVPLMMTVSFLSCACASAHFQYDRRYAMMVKMLFSRVFLTCHITNNSLWGTGHQAYANSVSQLSLNLNGYDERSLTGSFWHALELALNTEFASVPIKWKLWFTNLDRPTQGSCFQIHVVPSGCARDESQHDQSSLDLI